MSRTSVVLLVALAALNLTCRPATVSDPPDIGQVIAANVSIMDGRMPLLRFSPPPIYAMWRAEVEQCSGRSREGLPSYWVAPAVFLRANGVLGMFLHPERPIVFGLGSETVDWIVRHEILHDILDVPHGTDAHPAEYFNDKCGPLVRPLHQ